MVNIMFLFCYPADPVYTDWVILRDRLVGGFIVEVTWEGKMSERRKAGWGGGNGLGPRDGKKGELQRNVDGNTGLHSAGYLRRRRRTDW